MNIRDSIRLSGNAKDEIARDLIALGGLPFYLFVLVRSTIGGYLLIPFPRRDRFTRPVPYIESRQRLEPSHSEGAYSRRLHVYFL